MTKLDLDQYKGYEGYGLQTSSTDDSDIPIWELDTTDRAEIGYRNNASGHRFEAIITDSLNHAIGKSGELGCAYVHASPRYPHDITFSLGPESYAIETKLWTRTKNHDHGFFAKREFYECRNAKRGRCSQVDAIAQYSRRWDQPAMLAVHFSGIDKVFFAPWVDLESTQGTLEEIMSYPAFPRKGRLFDIDLAVILALARGDQDE